ncbi:NAD(P)H-quinone oxidoreductase subunit 5, chloroplastic, partial [Mucuna pruriens]
RVVSSPASSPATTSFEGIGWTVFLFINRLLVHTSYCSKCLYFVAQLLNPPTRSLIAMERPIPISTLIHAAIMVMVGIFLVAQLLPLFIVLPAAMNEIVVTGIITVVSGVALAIAQNDTQNKEALRNVESSISGEVVLGAPLRVILKHLAARTVAPDIDPLVALVHRPNEAEFCSACVLCACRQPPPFVAGHHHRSPPSTVRRRPSSSAAIFRHLQPLAADRHRKVLSQYLVTESRRLPLSLSLSAAVCHCQTTVLRHKSTVLFVGSSPTYSNSKK